LNQGFCRGIHVADYLLKSADERLQALGSELSIGLDVEEENFDWLEEELAYAIQIVSSHVPVSVGTDTIGDPLGKFVDDLKTGVELLKEVWGKYEHDLYSFEIA
jgi:hypothetical protein